MTYSSSSALYVPPAPFHCLAVFVCTLRNTRDDGRSLSWKSVILYFTHFAISIQSCLAITNKQRQPWNCVKSFCALPRQQQQKNFMDFIFRLKNIYLFIGTSAPKQDASATALCICLVYFFRFLHIFRITVEKVHYL